MSTYVVLPKEGVVNDRRVEPANGVRATSASEHSWDADTEGSPESPKSSHLGVKMRRQKLRRFLMVLVAKYQADGSEQRAEIDRHRKGLHNRSRKEPDRSPRNGKRTAHRIYRMQLRCQMCQIWRQILP
ncbi:hypothetical protein M427DRAFT_320155 [Gonapodya prolifera JEL478]|uniref:Uncharacterized protein n=1 Tax=Gonapodya prolifera (strain JEL478) TaxID=1344416 RepID=A0A139AG49_GONPJ|nr:hypothetical protein M427DRAFT_320155 [Gonapodya prolifera JEL478]|eukprot:KXS15669.1 hypothetical protein M427DRAFT_320155 [Gonapodya prolifera JEL478]